MSKVSEKFRYSFKHVFVPGKPKLFDDATAASKNMFTIVKGTQTGVTRCLKGDKLGTFVLNYKPIFNETLEHGGQNILYIVRLLRNICKSNENTSEE